MTGLRIERLVRNAHPESRDSDVCVHAAHPGMTKNMFTLSQREVRPS